MQPPPSSGISPPPVAAIPPGQVSAAEFRCIACGYDLSGTVIGGQCPECGSRVAQSLQAAGVGEKSSPLAMWSMIIGIVGIAICGVVGPAAIIMGHIARNQMKAGGYSRNAHGFATAGFVLGIISTALTVLAVGFLLLVGNF